VYRPAGWCSRSRA